MTSQLSPIQTFFHGRSIFITGGTGFLGKVLIEKIIRSCPGVGTVYLLMRGKDGEDPQMRLRTLFQAPLYDKVREMAISKVVAINGDILEPGLGISQSDLNVLVANVSVVFHSAASVKFDEPLKRAIDINTLATRRVLELCHKLDECAAFIHVSTAYAFCNRAHISESVHPEHIHYQKVIDAAGWMDEALSKQALPTILDNRPSTYHYTKALAENLLVEEGGTLPIVIVRPSIVTATWREPFGGWVDNYNGPAGFVIATGKGVLRTLVVKPDCVADVFPVDLVVNLMLTSAWYAHREKITTPFVVNCTSGPIRQLTFKQIFDYSRPIVLKYPSNEIFRYPGGSMKTSIFWNRIATVFDHHIPAYIADFMAILVGRKPVLRDVYRRIERAMDILVFFTNHSWTFQIDNLNMLQGELRDKDKVLFDFDIRPIDWLVYLEDYILGVRKYVLKEDPSTIPAARAKLNSGDEKVVVPKKQASWTEMCNMAAEPTDRIYYIGLATQVLFVAGIIRLLIKHTETFNDLWWSFISRALQLAIQINMRLRASKS